ncbi:MAG: CBS domain-containing protein [Planctomycetota bacterium]|jgi:CBS domain-containing protein
MAKENIQAESNNSELRNFMRALLEDVRAVERMIDENLFETGIRRIGAEQEMFLVDRSLRPTNKAQELLKKLDPRYFTTELGQFNLECNLDPQKLEGTCLSDLEGELNRLLGQVRAEAAKMGTSIVLTGILPTLEKEHLGLESMTPVPRYYQLNRVMRELRGGEFRTMIKGRDELQTTHDNVMLEACNTSFQIHFQVGPSEFAKLYNLAQVVTAPVLAAGVNSPVLLRRRLWKETRVALFQQSIDTRSDTVARRGARSRVSFGENWVENSVLEIFREDIARFRVLVAAESEESPLAKLDRGEIPDLKALRLHNGTVYRWNRPCYGVNDGVAHLRIEARALPAGPTVIDEVANAAFFYGLMCALSEEYEDTTKIIPFTHAQENFMASARYGLNARLHWVGDKVLGADELILDRLLPAARAGLAQRGIASGDIDRYLGVIEERVEKEQTGSRWILDSLESMGERGRPSDRHEAIVRASITNEMTGEPVARWELARIEEVEDLRASYRQIRQIMTTDLFTVHAEDLIDLAASVMDWEHVRHVPVEDHEGRLVGLISHRHVLRMIAHGASEGNKPVAVREVMQNDPVSVTADTSTLDAIAVMRDAKVGCLPVVEDGKLVGIVTESDFIAVSAKLLDRWLRDDD